MGMLFSRAAGRAPTLSLATPGLAAIDESLVKSLLHVLTGHTRVTWRHVSGLDADVALCVPGNPLAEQARSRESQAGRPLCVALDDFGARPTGWSRTLHRPIRMRNFLGALEAVAAELEADVRELRQAAPTTTDVATGTETRSLVDVLRQLHRTDDGGTQVLRVKAGTHELLVHLPHGRCHSAEGFSDEALADLSSPYHHVTVEPADVTPLGEAGGSDHDQWVALETLLWRMGLLGRGQTSLGSDPMHACYRLTRWPDLGKIPSNILHVRLTALFSKRAMTINEAAGLLEMSPEPVRDFLRACGCCGILEMTQQLSLTVGAERHARRRHPGGLFNRLRSALGMRY